MWGEFTHQLEYKAKWYGRTFIKIDRFYPSSKTCSACGHILEALTLDVREWVCPSCGVCHDRDINAACNILAVGLTASVCGGRVRPVDSKGLQATPVETENLTRECGESRLPLGDGRMSKSLLQGDRA